ncbi:DUF1000-domain-containing protein [Roridomyces roridus]|uniref:DUF1000-domain-containing protein n=1 Tax=Roridomyces roridus TaxID=1738132 RepID=A0AAD7FQJ6_9AGAR|nr:DUF1000-domain-containing protein [Roridomyces roridus]
MAASNDQVSLLALLDSQLQCLNENDEHPLRSILEDKKLNARDSYLLSDVDAELLLSLQFNQAVRISAVRTLFLFGTAQDNLFKLVLKSTVFEEAPKQVKLFVNHPSIGFEHVESDDPVAEIDIGADDKNALQEGYQIPLQQGRRIKVVKFSKLQTVTSLHIFVASNQGGGDVTRIDGIDVLGYTPETTKNLSGLKKVEDN